MSSADVVSLVFLGLPIIDWSAVIVLHRVVARFGGDSLRDRRNVALAIAVLTSVFATLALARLGHIQLSNDLAVLAIGLSVVGLSLVNLVFLVRYWRAAFS